MSGAEVRQILVELITPPDVRREAIALGQDATEGCDSGGSFAEGR
jgi:hypothetical protein